MPETNLTLSPSDGLRTDSERMAAAQRDRRMPPLRPDLPATASPPLAVSETVVVLELHGDLAAVEREWRAFEAAADCTVFQSFDWLAKWQQHIGAAGGTIPAIVVGRDDEGGLLFILQLAIEPRGPVRRLSWLGSDLCDYNAPLLAGHFADAVSPERFACLWRDIVRLLRAAPRFRFDLVDLQKMPEAVGGQRNPFLDIGVRANPSGAYVATLGHDWDTFYAAKRSSATRKRERRQLKNLTEHGEVRFIDVREGGDIERTLATLIDQKSRSFARMGVEDLFARPGYRAFYLDIATDRSARALTHVSRLDVGVTTAAVSLGLRFRDCYYLVLSSYQDGEIARFGPGRAHLHELLRHAIDCGFRRFDFTIGDEPYKRDWSDIEVRLCDHLEAVSLRGTMVVAMATAYRRTKRFIKQTPVLWHAYSKVRGMLGRR
jgi:CelD/BcsL family acetyltransferase involved in cellulose biosynthesis